jgi:type I restriction enzyme, S subunit
LTAQQAIADFLERETAPIDQLIERKQRMVELTLERQAVRLDRITFNGDAPRQQLFRPFFIYLQRRC